jgi:hypothetical protein
VPYQKVHGNKDKNLEDLIYMTDSTGKGGKYFTLGTKGDLVPINKDVYTHLMRNGIPVMHMGDDETEAPIPFIGNPCASGVNCKLGEGIQNTLGAMEPIKTLSNGTKRFGQKHDNGKLRYDLVPCTAYRQLVEVLTVGAAKYGDENWKKVDQAERRYYAACMRHLESHRSGELVDQEDGKTHLAHAMCCVLFLLELQNMKGVAGNESGN